MQLYHLIYIYSYTEVVSFVLTRSVCVLSQVVLDGLKLYTKSLDTLKRYIQIWNKDLKLCQIILSRNL